MNGFDLDIIKKAIAAISRPPKPRELAQHLHIGQNDYRAFRQFIKNALAKGDLARIRGGRIVATSFAGKVKGKLVIARSGIGFVMPEDNSGEIFISGDDLGGALPGEQVLVELKSYRSGKSREGRVVKVIQRAGSQLVGKLEKTRHGWQLKPDDPRISHKIELDNPDGLALRPNYMAVVVLYEWRADFLPPMGKVSEILGPAGSPGVDIDALVRSSGVPIEFASAAIAESKKIGRTIPDEEIKARVDLRKLTIFTIDPPDARDHDDAVSYEEMPDGLIRLGVHIADVSHYVTDKSALDKDALLRGNSIYLVDRVIPMLPDILSGDMCSLHEGVDRLTLTAFIYLDQNANIKKYDIVKSVINSAASLNYDEVQRCLDNKPSPKLEKYAVLLAKMNDLAKKLKAKRVKAGSLDFDLPEPKVVLDPEGNVVDIFRYPRYDSHRLIEEFMLIANCVVAQYMMGLGAPILYRVHDRPDDLKVQVFAEMLKELGFDFSFKGEITPKKIQRVLESAKGRKEEEFIHRLLLRSLAKAVYQPENIGHFGLAFPVYAHFTSPIRRYPDLHLHRVLKLQLEKRLDSLTASKIRSTLTSIGTHCSQTEIMADGLERESVKIKMLDYFADKIGSVMPGTVSGVVRGGIFVEIDNMFIDGFIPYTSFEDDYYIYDEKKHQAIGRRKNKRYRLGDHLEVVVARVDREKRELDLLPADKFNLKTRRGKRKK
ncbi:MAG: ribonuclease R [candidate division Zixibacteria bacterium]|nr:ribonuclease R [candidate division Zixibacteria bacterium]